MSRFCRSSPGRFRSKKKHPDIKGDGHVLTGRIGFVPTAQASNEHSRKYLYEEAGAKYDEIEWIKEIETAYWRRMERRFMPYEAQMSYRANTYRHEEISVLM